MPASIRSWSAPLKDADKFAMGSPGFGHDADRAGTAREARGSDPVAAPGGTRAARATCRRRNRRCESRGGDVRGPRCAAPDRRPARRRPGAGLVLGLHLLDPGRLLRAAADPRPDGRGGRHREPALAVHRHPGRHAGPEPALRLPGEAHAAGAVRAAHLPVLRRQHPGLRAGALPRAAGLGRLDRPGVLRLAVDLQPVRGLDLLGDHRRRVLERAGQAPVRLHRGRRDARAPSRARPPPRSSPRTCRPGA